MRAALAERVLKMLRHFGRDEELGIGRPAVGGLRLGDFLGAERLAVGLGRVGFRRRAVADDALDDDQRRAAVVREEALR